MNTITHPILMTDDSGFEVEAVVRIEFDYSPFERATRDCPGRSEEVRVTAATVFVGNFELGPHPAPLSSWESEVWAHINAERQADELDRALARAA
jgi:hypothetical protein